MRAGRRSLQKQMLLQTCASLSSLTECGRQNSKLLNVQLKAVENSGLEPLTSTLQK